MGFAERIKVRRIADGMLGTVRGFNLVLSDDELYYGKEGDLKGKADGEYLIENKTDIEIALEEALDKLNIVGEQLVMCLNAEVEIEDNSEEEKEKIHKNIELFLSRSMVNVDIINSKLNLIKEKLI